MNQIKYLMMCPHCSCTSVEMIFSFECVTTNTRCPNCNEYIMTSAVIGEGNTHGRR